MGRVTQGIAGALLGAIVVSSCAGGQASGQAAQEGRGGPSPAPSGATAEEVPTPSATPTPTPTLKPLKQPEKEWAEPKLQPDPGEKATTLVRVKYELVKQVWLAAGIRAATTAECELTEAELAVPGDHEYRCVVTYSGVDVPYTLETTTTEEVSTSVIAATFLPVTKEKALHELTRQAIKPAEVRCTMDDVQLIVVDDPDALRCQVTDIYGVTRSYRGEVSAGGGVFFTAQG